MNSPGASGVTKSFADREIFRFGTWAWDVTAGLALVADREPEPVDISPCREFAALVHVTSQGVASADLSRPLLIAPIPHAGLLVIDGWHRIHRAFADGITILPSRQLTPAEERAIRLRG
ncbi:hypothetical protein [Cryptosporangium sp. NPDC048952]|uniref:hypothetical protein n=1 Tax=Cryptosporangium sp. NPDC048952 TaxID=3363961 RepID=UPI0037138563